MENLVNIANTNKILFEKLLKYNCIATKDGKKIFEGNINDIKLDDKETGEKIVCEFEMEDNTSFICTMSYNKYINEMLNIIGNNNIDDVLNNPKTYNKLMNLSFNLPVLNTINENAVIKKGSLYKTILENYNFK